HGHDRHLGAARLVAADRRLDRAMRTRRGAPDKREIAALERPLAAMISELLGEGAMGLVGLGNDEKAARVLVEAMHDARARHAANAREARAAMGNEGVDQGAVDIAGA